MSGSNGCPKLTARQTAFIAAYLANGWNGLEAARTAGYKGNYDTLGVQAHQVLSNNKVRAAIDAECERRGITKGQVVQRLSEVANVNIAQFLDRRGRICFSRVRKYGYLVKEYQAPRKGQPARLRLHDSMQALALMAKIRGMLVDRVELDATRSGPVQHKIEVVVVRPALAALGNGNGKEAGNGGAGPSGQPTIEVGSAQVTVVPPEP